MQSPSFTTTSRLQKEIPYCGGRQTGQTVVRRFPKLTDEFDGCTVGYGYTAFRNQLENRLWYTKRPLSMKRRSDGVKRRLDVNENENVNPKKRMCGGYGSR